MDTPSTNIPNIQATTATPIVGQQLTYPLDHTTQEILRGVMGTQQAFPVGSIFISVSASNPLSSLGYGTWTSFAAGRVLVGLDPGQAEFDTVEETGGSKTHTLTTAEIPSHSHGGVLNDNGGPINPGPGGGFNLGNTDLEGGGGAHNNLQPYIVVYMWKRVS